MSLLCIKLSLKNKHTKILKTVILIHVNSFWTLDFFLSDSKKIIKFYINASPIENKISISKPSFNLNRKRCHDNFRHSKLVG